MLDEMSMLVWFIREVEHAACIATPDRLEICVRTPLVYFERQRINIEQSQRQRACRLDPKNVLLMMFTAGSAHCSMLYLGMP